MLSKMCKTAIKAVIYLCSQSEQKEYAGIKQIAASIESSEHSVGKILQSLVKNKIICSLKGPAGGFFISNEQQQLAVLSIVEAIDGRDRFTECGLGLSRCSSAHPCPIHFQYEEIRTKMERMFREKTIADLFGSVNAGEAYLIG